MGQQGYSFCANEYWHYLAGLFSLLSVIFILSPIFFGKLASFTSRNYFSMWSRCICTFQVATRADQHFSGGCIYTLCLLLGRVCHVYINSSVSHYYEVSGVQGLCTHVSPVHGRQVCGRPFGGPSHSHTSFGSTKSFSSNQSSKFVHCVKRIFKKKFIINKISPLAWLCFDLQNQNGVFIEKEE